MNRINELNGAVTALVLSAAAGLFLTGCSGGDGGHGDLAFIGSISVQGLTAPIFGASSAPNSGQTARLNAAIAFDFGGAIDPSSLPPDGPAASKILIRTLVGTEVVFGSGTWSIDLANPRRAYFRPYAGSDPAQPCFAGLAADSEYVVSVLSTGSTTTSVVVDGRPVVNAAQATFTTGTCIPAQSTTAFFDPAPDSAPTLIDAFPPLGPTAPAVALETIAQGSSSRLSIDLDQAVVPTSVSGLEIYDVSTNALVALHVTASVAFAQSGFVPGISDERCRITLETQSELADGRVYELRTANPILDYAGNAFSIAPGELRFSTVDRGDDQDFLSLEGFETTANRCATTGAVRWDGSGIVTMVDYASNFGTGVDGAGTLTTSMSINTNTNQGTFNFTSLTIGAGAVPPIFLVFTSPTNDPATATSTWPVRLRSQSTITVMTNVTLNLVGRMGANGVANNGASFGLGGWGGPGGGRGGISSPNISTPDLVGGNGEGSRINDIPAPDGGGQGGISGPPGNLGPSGGGGGSGSHIPGRLGTRGESQSGMDGSGLGAPPGGAPGAPSPDFLPPIVGALGGQGGGAGGDRADTGGVALHDTGGAGGGGGGGIELSAAGVISVGQTAQIICVGGNGGSAAGFLVAKGGGGSGGTILLRTPTDVTFGIGVTLSSDGGRPSAGAPTPVSPPTTPADGDGGEGGDGVIQIEDADGAVPGINLSVVLGETFFQVYPFTTAVVGQAITCPIDTGSASVRYVASNVLGATGAVTTNGVGLAVVEVRGILDDPLNPGTPALNDPNAVTPLVPLAAIESLNGYRYFQVILSLSYPAPITLPAGSTLPSVDSVSIAYRR